MAYLKAGVKGQPLTINPKIKVITDDSSLITVLVLPTNL